LRIGRLWFCSKSFKVNQIRIKVNTERKLLKLLVSPIDEKEALEAVAGGADIIDVKNPKEGALGAGFPWIIKRIREVTPKRLEVSCTLGDLPNLPGSVALAALGAASTGVNYIKASLHGIKTPAEAVYLIENVVKAAKTYNSSIMVAATGFADAKRIGSVNPLLIPQIAHQAGADIAMLDTAVKDGQNLLNFLKQELLKAFVDEAHSYDLKAALAGSLKKENLPALCGLSVDIIGVRGAACTGGDRVNGRITKEKVAELVQIVHKAKLQLSTGF
jgi:(5-formylfuran-3-yl)methyl phosphate synthase